jgi:hypothetical protein
METLNPFKIPLVIAKKLVRVGELILVALWRILPIGYRLINNDKLIDFFKKLILRWS